MSTFGPDGSDADRLREIEERVRTRLSAVERQNERLQGRTRLLGLGLLVAAAVLAIVAVAPDTLAIVGLRGPGDVVEARAFRLVDEGGATRGTWSVDGEGRSRLSLTDQQGRERLNLTVMETGSPGVALVNRDGARRVVLGLLPDETANLLFADAGGVPRVQIGMTPQEGSHFLLADANGAPRLGLALDGAGGGTALLPDSTASTEGRTPGDGGF